MNNHSISLLFDVNGKDPLSFLVDPLSFLMGWIILLQVFTGNFTLQAPIPCQLIHVKCLISEGT